MSERSDILTRVEQAIGHRFADRSLLETALTHPSWAAEHEGARDYERLEFLGDAVLGMVVAERLFAAFPDTAEGELTKRKIAAVSGQRLARAVREHSIAEAILVGLGERDTGREKDSILENVAEALIGAAYLDGGLEAARAVVERLLGDLASLDEAPPPDPKSALQELTQARGLGLPAYRLVETSGPPHARRFVVEVSVAGEPVSRGSGRSKRAAEKVAAQRALDALASCPDEG
ncbi:MAG: ribonuclease III [Anaerosomatales bacterium]|nr:ribonuclease III [Anaerosomatales bacterium]